MRLPSFLFGCLLALTLTACGDESSTSPDTPNQFSILLSADPADGGEVTGGGQIDGGVSLSVTAAPSEGYRFTQWAEDARQVAVTASYSFFVDRDRDLTAKFTREFEITTAVHPGYGGTAEGDGIYLDGQTITLSATPNAGYEFEGWMKGEEVILTFREVSESAALTAHFALDTVRGRWSPGGTYTDWHFPDTGYESLEWTFIPIKDPPSSLTDKGLLHYYA